jgi:hypothetical protein
METELGWDRVTSKLPKVNTQIYQTRLPGRASYLCCDHGPWDNAIRPTDGQDRNVCGDLSGHPGITTQDSVITN